MNGIYWLASYPKSGNTWFRAFLANLRGTDETPADINALGDEGIASGRRQFDLAVGYDSGDLTCEEIERLQPETFEYRAGISPEPLYLKVHDAYHFLPDGRAIFPPASTLGAIYLIRNPLDVCVSFGFHSSVSDLETVVSRMENENYAFCASSDHQHFQLRQRLLSWSSHVLSWADATGFPVQVVRYEDMKQDPQRTFARAAEFLGLPSDAGLIDRALNACSFENLKRQEDEKGFRERLSRTASFFRKGEIGSWSENLTDEQAARIIVAHKKVMIRFGYLDESGEPVY